MKLPGRLSATTLGDVLGSLYRERASGVLELIEERGPNAGRSHRVFLRAGLVEDVQTALAAPKLGEVLLRDGAIGLEALRRLARRLLVEPHRRAGQILIEEGVASVEAIARGLRRQRLSRLDALFRLQDALIRFHVPRPSATGPDQSPPLSADEVLSNRPRARQRDRGRRAASRLDDERRLRAYRALGLAPDAGPGEVRKAFRRLAASVHPDRFPSATPAERSHLLARFAEFSAAYHALVG